MNGREIQLAITSRRRLVREAICGCLAGRTEFSVVGQTSNIDALTSLCALRRPDVILVDAIELTVPKVEALQRVRSALPGTAIVVTYAEVSPQALAVAAAVGVTQLVPSSRGLEAVLRRVRECARPAGRRQPDGLALTGHDVQVVSLLSSGRGVRDMANVLQVSPRTVENRKRRLYAKLGVSSASHAVSRAVSLGVIGQAPAEQAHPQEMPVRLAAGSSAAPALTSREHDILSLLASGRTIRQTAQALGIAAKTVENAQSHIFRKLGVRNRAEAIALAYRLGLLDLDT